MTLNIKENTPEIEKKNKYLGEYWQHRHLGLAKPINSIDKLSRCEMCLQEIIII
jgi:hypothetical protein